MSAVKFQCVLESASLDAADRAALQRAFDRYLADSADRVDALDRELAEARGDVAFILENLRERGPVSGTAEAAHRIWLEREEALARLDRELRVALESSSAAGGARPLADWVPCTSTLRRPVSGAELSFAQEDPLEILRGLELADGSRVVPDCWPCAVGGALVGLAVEMGPLREAYLSARTRFEVASRQAMLVRARALDLDWELVAVTKAGDRDRIREIQQRKVELAEEWGALLLEPSLDLERAERQLREALVSSLSPEAAKAYEARHRAIAFGPLGQDPLSATAFLAWAQSSEHLPKALRDRLATIDATHQAEEQRRSREIIEADLEHWPTLLARRADDRSLRLGLLAQRADRLLARRALHIAAWEDTAAAFIEFDLEPPSVPAQPENSLKPLLAEIAPFHLGGIPYQELAETFLAEHAAQQPRRSRGRPSRDRGG